MKKERMYSQSDIARASGRANATVYDWIQAGLLPKPKFTVGGNTIFTLEQFQEAVRALQSHRKRGRPFGAKTVNRKPKPPRDDA